MCVVDEEVLCFWIEKINCLEFFNFGFVECFYFKFEYFLAVIYVLFELVIDGFGFLEDEIYEYVGEKLLLLLFLELKWVGIEEFVCFFDILDVNV